MGHLKDNVVGREFHEATVAALRAEVEAATARAEHAEYCNVHGMPREPREKLLAEVERLTQERDEAWADGVRQGASIIRAEMAHSDGTLAGALRALDSVADYCPGMTKVRAEKAEARAASLALALVRCVGAAQEEHTVWQEYACTLEAAKADPFLPATAVGVVVDRVESIVRGALVSQAQVTEGKTEG